MGIVAKLQKVEWAQWLSGTYGNKNYDLTLISHVEPFDLGNFAKPDYYWGYHSEQFAALYEKLQNAARPAARARLQHPRQLPEQLPAVTGMNQVQHAIGDNDIDRLVGHERLFEPPSANCLFHPLPSGQVRNRLPGQPLVESFKIQ